MADRPSQPGSAPAAFRSISDVSAELGVRPHMLRYWEEQFPMLAPLKRAGGRRHYRAEDVALLRRIHMLVVGQGYTIRGARAAIAGQAGVDTGLAGRLGTLRERLARALAES